MDKFFEIMRQIQAAFEAEIRRGQDSEIPFYKHCLCAAKGSQSVYEYLMFMYMSKKLPVLVFDQATEYVAKQMGVSLPRNPVLVEPEITGFWKRLHDILEEHGMKKEMLLEDLSTHLQLRYPDAPCGDGECRVGSEAPWIVQWVAAHC